MTDRTVTVIGLGPMGRAMVNAFLDRGYQVTVWNRTAAKADELVRRGARRAATVDEALAANELVVLSLTDYDAMYAILGPATTALSGRVIANLSSDTPEQAREAATWLAERGAQQLTGGVQVPPSGIGTPDSATYYSGPADAFEAHRQTLEVLTSADYQGEDPGLAALRYQLQMNMFWTIMVSWLHTVAVARTHGITATEFLPVALKTADVAQFLEFYAPRIDAGDHRGDVDRLAMGEASIRHVLHTVRAAGVDTTLPAAVLDAFQRGMADGRVDQSFTSLVEVFAADTAVDGRDAPAPVRARP
ncbi:NAD(P)-binding domain-containing protein [Micromonospora peucetia]|uniref:NAD(P)-dependent oxidoreductase n=1 Tax=Micromonospora peucetia TaxID=47871 RepID=UPI0022509183|nr:NAD(P)-binding domain-containing protein [Micromonospora peucetia]MCX4387462.1 NAD(P)-binding domain-containing protein [Micromonospora peucetia]